MVCVFTFFFIYIFIINNIFLILPKIYTHYFFFSSCLVFNYSVFPSPSLTLNVFSFSPLLQVLPKVRVEDMGHKMGLNGVDNAKLSFDNVRVPRENLLNRYSDVTAEGEFASKIKRFVLCWVVLC